MLRLACLAGAVATVLAATPVLAQPEAIPLEIRRGYASSELEGDSATIRFYRWGEMILVDNVMINGQGPFRFMLDTGAEGAGRLDRSLVERLDVAASGDAASVGLLGQEHGMTTHRLDTLSIGPLAFHDVQMLSRDYRAEMPRDLRPVDGILGFHLFSEYLFTIDYPGRSLRVERGELPPPDGDAVLPIVSDDDDPDIMIDVGGHPIQALIDTGAPTHFAFPTALTRDLATVGEPRLIGRDGGQDVFSATLEGAIRLGAVSFDEPQVIIAPALTQAVVGVRAMASLALTFDQANARVRITRPAPRPRYGMTFSPGERGLTIREVAPGSPAEAAGLEVGDLIVSLNERVTSDLDREDMARMFDDSPLVAAVEREDERFEATMTLPLPEAPR